MAIAAVTRINASISELKGNAVAINASLFSLASNIINANASISDSKSGLSNSNASIDGLQTNMVNANASITSIDNSVINANASISGLQANVINLNSSIDTFNNGLLNANASISELKTNVINANASIDNLGFNATIIDNINASITSLKSNVVNANASIGDLQTNVINLNASIGNLSNNLTNINASISDSQIRIINLNASIGYLKEEFIPIEWGKNASYAPDAAEDITQSYQTVVVRKFRGASFDQKLSIIVRAPSGIQSDTIQFRSHILITATPPSDKGVVFGMRGHARFLGASYGTEITASKLNLTGTLNPKYSQDKFEWSSPITIASLESGRLAFLEYIRRQSSSNDDYGEKIGVPGFDIRWI